MRKVFYLFWLFLFMLYLASCAAFVAPSANRMSVVELDSNSTFPIYEKLELKDGEGPWRLSLTLTPGALSHREGIDVANVTLKLDNIGKKPIPFPVRVHVPRPFEGKPKFLQSGESFQYEFDLKNSSRAEQSAFFNLGPYSNHDHDEHLKYELEIGLEEPLPTGMSIQVIVSDRPGSL